MSNSVSVQYSNLLSTTETIAAAAGDITTGNGNVLHSGFNQIRTMNASTVTPASAPAAQCAYFKKTLSSGAGTIDLTAAPGTNGGAINFTGQKIRAAQITAPAGNGAAITITPDASNGYNLFGGSSSITVPPGADLLFFLADGAPVVGSGAKIIDLTGTGSTDSLNIALIGG